MALAVNQLAETAVPSGIVADLIAVLVAVTDGTPRVMTIRDFTALPSGPFELGHRSLQSGLRAWVEQQTGHVLGYVEQLYTFADSDRTDGEGAQHAISISYLGLTREEQAPRAGASAGWADWYDYFPWEDRRGGPLAGFDEGVVARLEGWAGQKGETSFVRQTRLQRVAVSFGLDGRSWNEELVLQRYELLHEAGMTPESRGCRENGASVLPGRPMAADHRRILATGIARLRAKIKYHPVVFELMPPTFTLLQLQRSVEALAGRLVHKQNFRRLIAQQDLVEETGDFATDTGGRPAQLYRFRHAVLVERAAVGTKLPLTKS